VIWDRGKGVIVDERTWGWAWGVEREGESLPLGLYLDRVLGCVVDYQVVVAWMEDGVRAMAGEGGMYA
jgi:hypothetical protein